MVSLAALSLLDFQDMLSLGRRMGSSPFKGRFKPRDVGQGRLEAGSKDGQGGKEGGAEGDEEPSQSFKDYPSMLAYRLVKFNK
jgi:hypothetical protein